MPFSTGLITNTRALGTAASNIVLSTRNIDTVNAATVTYHIFASADSSVFYTAYMSSFIVDPNYFDVREFFIAGNVACEVQVSVSDSTSTLISVFGIDESGNLVTNQGKLQEDLSFITSLSPVIL
ncbi:hypothetical protein LOZ80_34745 [Paenibacillus sp. HWE-109]|uniref:hypothetical protein n=1 Tax=Paenibacillus sp. HWE-109 TaxID=1306526 RepID=UPI001EDDF14A|nr:hypothetical protein [Paenibacillus sp. HWE-109]UKS26617.1 hypothetical protein LOZ80_34745 [Paenibacillus sp. HWE-109]